MDTSHIDLVALVQRDVPLKRVAGTQGGEYHGRCPMCGGKDRLLVQVNRNGMGGRWLCRQCHQKWQDPISYLMIVKGATFQMAVQELSLTLPAQPVRARRTPPSRPQQSFHIATLDRDHYPALTSLEWWRAADQIVLAAQDALWSPMGQAARDYLHNRGITDGAMASASLGLIPQDTYQPKANWGIPVKKGDKPNVYLPQGILIPWLLEAPAGKYTRYWRLNIRRPQGNPKYIGPAGAANGLYSANEIYHGCTVVMVEGELDVLVIRSQALDLLQRHKGIIPVATGSASGALLTHWLIRVAVAGRVLLAFDADEAGDKAAQWWQEKLGAKAQRLRPTQHDITDMYKAGEDVRGFILSALS